MLLKKDDRMLYTNALSQVHFAPANTLIPMLLELGTIRFLVVGSNKRKRGYPQNGNHPPMKDGLLISDYGWCIVSTSVQNEKVIQKVLKA